MVLDQVFSCPPRRFRQVGNGVGQMTSRKEPTGRQLKCVTLTEGRERDAFTITAPKYSSQRVIVKHVESSKIFERHRPDVAVVE